jgi:large subunit ribosomal protein L22
MPVKAIAKGVKISPRKVSVVAGLVKKRSVSDALTILEHTPRASAKAVSKVIKSAAANAQYNHNYKPNSLVITEISVTPGPRIKRYRPAARGQALPFQKKSAHIRVVVDGEIRQPKQTELPKKLKASKQEAK